jgi:hypothetical protein
MIRRYHHGDIVRVDEDWVCMDCFRANEYIDCFECGTPVHPDNSWNRTIDGDVEQFCEGCYSDRRSALGECYQCDEEIDAFATLSVQGNSYCSDCAREKIENIIEGAITCSGECDDHRYELTEVLSLVTRVNSFGITTREWTCERCEFSYINQLPSGNPFTVGRWLYDYDEDDTVVCTNCEPGRIATRPRTYTINSYSFKPPPEFRRTARDLDVRALHFGTEVEVEMQEGVDQVRALEQIAKADTENIFYCKADTTINNGFELVSHPFTFNWMVENPGAFQAQFALGEFMRGWSAENCGMHIHMSADAFNNLHLFKFMRFFYQNPGFIRAMARRPKGKLDKWANMEAPSKKSLMAFALNRRMNMDMGRGALDVETEGKQTIECRIFRSTLSPTGYYGNVEFLQSLFDYTKGCGMSDEQLTADRLMKFTRERGSAYSNFLLLTDIARPELQDNWEV